MFGCVNYIWSDVCNVLNYGCDVFVIFCYGVVFTRGEC